MVEGGRGERGEKQHGHGWRRRWKDERKRERESRWLGGCTVVWALYSTYCMACIVAPENITGVTVLVLQCHGGLGSHVYVQQQSSRVKRKGQTGYSKRGFFLIHTRAHVPKKKVPTMRDEVSSQSRRSQLLGDDIQSGWEEKKSVAGKHGEGGPFFFSLCLPISCCSFGTVCL